MSEVNLRKKLEEILRNKDTGKSQYAIQPLSDVEKRKKEFLKSMGMPGGEKEEKKSSISKPFIYGTVASYLLMQNIFPSLGLGVLAALFYRGYKEMKEEIEEKKKLNSEWDQVNMMYGIPGLYALFAGTVWYRKWQKEREEYRKNPTKAMVLLKSYVDSCIESSIGFVREATKLPTKSSAARVDANQYMNPNLLQNPAPTAAATA